MTELSVIGRAGEYSPGIPGRINDIGKGGLCAAAEQYFGQGSLVRCEFLVYEMPVPIPTLMQVRWVEKEPGKQYRIGLKFLF
jgi:hypothetical protein